MSPKKLQNLVQKIPNKVIVPKPVHHKFYGYGVPSVNPETLIGTLIVIEGADGSGRSTQISMLVDWLECTGHATVQSGIKRSTLVSEELNQAQKGNILSHTTLSLFYATDFADQLENVIIPALKSGFVVLADRYIYTLMARDMVRGMDETWLRNLYGMAVVPDAVFHLNVSPEILVQRNFAKKHCLDYWESGMDLGLSRDMFDSFLIYQKMLQGAFERLQEIYGLSVIDVNHSVEIINNELKKRIETILKRKNTLKR